MGSRSTAPGHSIATEFVTEAFETDVDDSTVSSLAHAVEDCVATLRDRINSDDRLESLRGLDREEATFVLGDFHQVQNPRIMTDEYFDRVLDVYDELAQEGPLP